jgi:hypothetical protein
MEALAGYLLYRFTILNPMCKLSLKGISNTPRFMFIWLYFDVLTLILSRWSTAPAYLHLLPPGTPPTCDLEEFLTLLAGEWVW